MHARHRSPGNGYRSNSMGSGMARISSDAGSVRGRGFYNSSEHRSFNRSFNRGHGPPKSFHRPPPPPPPQPRKGDIFMEAGRLATEYLVSRGVLPSSVLKWQNNGSLKNDFQEFRAQEGDNMYEGGRASALSRLGTGNDVASGKRRYVDEFGPSGLRNYPKGKRRGGSFKGYSSDWGRGYSRSGSWSDRRGNSDMDNDSESSHHDEQITERVNKDSSQLGRKEENASVERPGGEVGEIGEIAESETQNSVSTGNSKERVEEEGSASIKMGKQIALEDTPTEQSEKIDDLRILCRYPNMPTRTRSPLTSRRRKAVAVGTTTFGAGTSKVSKVVVEDETLNGSSVDNNNPCLDTDTPPVVVSLEEAKPSSVLAPVLGVDQEEHQESNVTPENDCQDQEPSQELPGGTEKRGEKRAAEESDGEGTNKKQREWLSSSCKEEAELEKVPEIKEEPFIEFAQEKQLFPNSFRICDLNLMEGLDANERGQTDYPSASKKEVSPVDVDLAISNSTITPIQAGRDVADHRVIEIIDLDDESTPEDKPFEPERKLETAFPSLDGFSNQLMSSSVIPDNQDNYGLMFSDFMANDFTSCSSVTGEMNPLDNMALHNAEGPLGVDDSIYMSFGEIPFLGFMPTWEQPPPHPDRKPF